MLHKLYWKYSSSSRRKRTKLLNSLLQITEETRILDLGGGDGSLIKVTIPFTKNICVANIDKKDLQKAKESGYNTMELDETGIIPCQENEFDIIFSNSVIEHVTVDKTEI